MKKGAINIHVQLLCGRKFSDQMGKYVELGLLDHTARVCLVLEENVALYSKRMYYFVFATHE
jgi:hypothetical protein